MRWSAGALLGAGMLAACEGDTPSGSPRPGTTPVGSPTPGTVFTDDLSAGIWKPDWHSLRYETSLKTFDGHAGIEMAPPERRALDRAHYMAYPILVSSVLARDVSVRSDVLAAAAAGAGVIARASFDAGYGLLVTPGKLLLSRYSATERSIINQAPLPRDGWWSLSLWVTGDRVRGVAESNGERVEVVGRDSEPLPAGYVGLLGVPLGFSSSQRVLFRRFDMTSADQAEVAGPRFAYAFTGGVVAKDDGFTANVTARTVVPVELSFEIAADPSFDDAQREGPIVPTGALKSVHAKLKDLESAREYFWRPIALHNGMDIRGPVRRFRTPPAPGEPVRFVFASCTSGGQSRYPSFQTARSLDPDFYLHAGDWGYVDGFALDKSADHFQAWWIRMMRAPGIAELLEVTPLMFWQDDHDYDADFGWAETVNPVAVQAFDELNANPSNEFFDVRWGDVHVWCLDCRKYATDPSGPDGPDKSRIGEEQKRWLKQGMLASDAPVRIVASSMVFRNKRDREPGWHNGAFAHERDELLKFFARLEATVVILSGDAHGHRLIHHFEFGELYEINSSGTDFGGNGESGNYDPEHTLINRGEDNGFAEIFLGAEHPDRELVVRVVERQGAVLFEKSFPVASR
jgi:hypothetical protein